MAVKTRMMANTAQEPETWLVPGGKFNAPKDLRESGIEKKGVTGYGGGMARLDISAELDPGAFGRNFDRLFLDLKRREGTTARAFAQDINVGEERVSKWRNGKLAVPALPTLLKIAIRFGVSVDVLLAGVCPGYSVQKSTATRSASVDNSALPLLMGTEGRYANIASTFDLRQLVALPLIERVQAARTLTIQLAALLKYRPEDASAGAPQPKRSTGRR